MQESGNINKGVYGENIAEGYLRAKGYEILASRFKCPYGEIDLIAMHNGVLVFAEVKFRKTTKAGFGAEAVTKQKQRRIIQTALHYIHRNNVPCDAYRFDVLDIIGREFYEINHIENAFFADGSY